MSNATTIYIAVDDEAMFVWGLGDSPESAIEDAEQTAGCTLEPLLTYPATSGLAETVKMHGGQIDWTLNEDGVAVPA